MRKLLWTTVMAALVAGACSKATDRAAGPPASPGTPTPSPAVTGSPSPLEAKPFRVYYLVSGESAVYITPEARAIGVTPTPEAALEELVRGTPQDPDHFSPYPRTARVNSVTVASGVATVDWSAEVLVANAGAETESRGIRAAVFTLTELQEIKKVRFTVEGKDRGAASNGRQIEDWWGHVGLSSQPFARADQPEIEVLAPIALFEPLDGARSTGTLTLTGEASTFEANVGILLRDAAGKEVLRTSATAAEAAPGRGMFSKTLTFTPPSTAQTWTLEAFEASAKDGSITFSETRSIKVG